MKRLAVLLLVLVSAAPLAAQAPKAGAPPAKPKAKAPKPSADALHFRVVTATGSHNKFAGTTAPKIFLLFNGDPSHKVRLTKGGEKPFQKGKRDVFEGLFIEMDPAEIASIKLVNESLDMWKCESISFQFFKKGEESTIIRFQPDVYLSMEKERKAFAAKPSVEFKLKVKLAPKKSEGGKDG